MYEATEKTITLRGRSKLTVERESESVEVEAASFTAVISSENPVNMNISSHIANIEAYKANIKQCREDENEFRTFVQGIQDEMLAAEKE